ncbi:MAG: tRNA(Ile)-lysidine synthase [Candidatus Peregrinibacteria bacterium GW2011_GWA2_44_7]|nr:MAG: tRNA(Ile)-lysidine synthase [Candidatus Peregrinibacteria bacterium GW2011_GWA2_44_7]
MKKNTLILACSGGADSVYLLHDLLNAEEKPIVAHFNHQLRGGASDADEAFVRSLAEEHQLVLEIERTDVAKWGQKYKKSLEEAGRILRYAFFEQVRKKYNGKAILTAHHLNDNLETVLMNRMRGCDLKGEIGMQEWNGFLHRPLLNTSKQEILDYLHKHQLPYREDASNQDRRYARNRIRLDVIPKLEQQNPDLLKEFKNQREKAIRQYYHQHQRARAWLFSHSTFLEAAKKPHKRSHHKTPGTSRPTHP